MSEDTAPEATDAKASRGRPRPDATVERDKIVYTELQRSAQTRKQLVESTGLPGNQVYLSLYRLSRQDPPVIVKNGATWSVADGSAQPVEAPVEAEPATEVPAE